MFIDDLLVAAATLHCGAHNGLMHDRVRLEVNMLLGRDGNGLDRLGDVLLGDYDRLLLLLLLSLFDNASYFARLALGLKCFFF
jgi:hypothetical protein